MAHAPSETVGGASMPRFQPSIRDRFGRRLRELRTAAGLTQEKLAFRADLDRSYVGQVERGEVNVSIDNIAKLAHGLRVSPAALFEAAERK
ncbi:MAG: helix-turn-helix transcriptional regulator [Gemmatimonadaceae bacterium]|nr:helix-turn-helix transcriptional regulator [Gemmatimonadaceae bacterium]